MTVAGMLCLVLVCLKLRPFRSGPDADRPQSSEGDCCGDDLPSMSIHAHLGEARGGPDSGVQKVLNCRKNRSRTWARLQTIGLHAHLWLVVSSSASSGDLDGRAERAAV